MDKQFYKYLNDILWWCPSKKLRYLIREYFHKMESIENSIEYVKQDNKEIINFLNTISNKIESIENNIEYIKQDNKEVINFLNIISDKIFFENNNTVVMCISGGFADQIRMYLVAKSLEKFYHKKIFYDISWYEIDGMDFDKKNKRYFEFKNIFYDIEFNLANTDQIYLSKKNNFINCWYELHKSGNVLKILETFNNEKTLYMEGVLALTHQKYIIQTDKTKMYIDNTFKMLNYSDLHLNFDKYFIPKLDEKNKEIYNDIINNKNTIACHTRRTDYVNYYYYDDLDFDYYKKAFEIIKNRVNGKIKIFFFSDDLNWVKENIVSHIQNMYDYKIVDVNTNEKGYFDFYLISKCQYQIASSGNFCKVAYEFNEFKDKILITPENISSM